MWKLFKKGHPEQMAGSNGRSFTNSQCDLGSGSGYTETLHVVSGSLKSR